MKKDSFIMYTEYGDMLEAVTAEQAGLIIRAMVNYSRDKAPDLTDPVVNAVFSTIRPRMDRDREKWEQEVKRRAEAGRKGGLAKASNAKLSQAKPSTSKERLARLAVSDSDTDIDNKEKSNKRETQLTIFNRLIVGRAISKDVEEALRDWLQYKTEKRDSYKETGLKSLITQAVNKSAEYGAAAVVNLINECIASNYSGIIWDRLGRKKPAAKYNNSPERTYDMDALELKLLASN